MIFDNIGVEYLMSSEIMKNIKAEIDVLLKLHGRTVLDSELAELLKVVDSKRSLSAACKVLGIPYASAWEKISRAESALGVKLIESRRGGKGGGGALLTNEAKDLLRTYDNITALIGRVCGELKPIPKPTRVAIERSELVIIGSHDPLLERLIGYVRDKNVKSVEVSWVGSLGGLASLLLGEADIVGIHLYDVDSGTYNISYVKRFMLERDVVLADGYYRELVFAFRPGLNILDVEEVIKRLDEGRLKLANRNKGSGTRLYLDYLLRKMNVDVRRVKGYETEYKTHFETTGCVASGRADVCLTLRYTAEYYKLKHVHVAWEEYDFLISKEKIKSKSVKTFLTILKSSKNMINEYVGYKAKESIGRLHTLK